MWVRNKYTGPDGGLYTGPGGGLYTGPGGGAYTGPGGGLYMGLGGGLYTGPDDNPYMSNWPPREYLLEALKKASQTNIIHFALTWLLEQQNHQIKY